MHFSQTEWNVSYAAVPGWDCFCSISQTLMCRAQGKNHCFTYIKIVFVSSVLISLCSPLISMFICLKIAYWLHGVITWEQKDKILLASLPMTRHSGQIKWEAVKDLFVWLQLNMLNIYSLFLEAPALAMLHCAFASSHRYEKTVKQNVLPSGPTYAKIPLAACLWEALKMKKLRSSKAFVDYKSPS